MLSSKFEFSKKKVENLDEKINKTVQIYHVFMFYQNLNNYFSIKKKRVSINKRVLSRVCLPFIKK